MKIVACVKQVPDTTEVKIDEKTGTLIREGVPSIINPFDQFAVELAIKLKEEHGGEVSVISMGPPQAKAVLTKSLALGADKAVLLSDRKFAGADTLATAYTLALAIEKLGDFDLVLCGLQAIDGDTAQVGPEMAQRLKIPQITYAENVVFEDNKFIVDKLTESGLEKLQVKPPALVAVITPSDFVPGNPPFSKIMKAKKKPLDTWTADDLGGDPERFGLNGSPTWVKRVYSPPRKEKGEILTDPPEEVAKRLVEILAKEGFL
ncbi:MAG: electron transfer flavoprotein subunit beta/FixA family protein [Thermoplasmata archaeon]|nr:MAG: electron transfer flavoprotein subunit beta/FixA family protein [Thermoplasmata archaeon]